MLFVPFLAIVLALSVLPSPWGFALVASVILWEVAEKTFAIRYSRRLPIVVGREALIGKPVTALSTMHPEGRVRLQGESWNAYCASGARRGETLVVKSLTGLTLVVGKPGE